MYKINLQKINKMIKSGFKKVFVRFILKFKNIQNMDKYLPLF